MLYRAFAWAVWRLLAKARFAGKPLIPAGSTRPSVVPLPWQGGLPLLLAGLLALPGPASAAALNVSVNFNSTVMDFDQSLSQGINVNVLRDSCTTPVINALRNAGIRSLRFAGYGGVFDLANSGRFRQEVRGSGYYLDWAYDSNGQAQYWTMNFDDFIRLCTNTAAKPTLIVGCESLCYTGTSPKLSRAELIQSASNWVFYANVMKGYGVKHWEIGNENDLGGAYGGKLTATEYGNFVHDVALAMKSVDPTIKIGANGGLLAQAQADAWWDGLLSACKTNIDFLITHQYSWYDGYAQWVDSPYTVGSCIDVTVSTRTRNNITGKPIYITEFGGSNPGAADQTNYVWRALHNIEVGLMAIHKQSEMVQFWVTRWLDSSASFWNAFDANYTNTAIGLSVKVMNDHLLDRLVSSTLVVNNNVRTWTTYDPATKAAAVFILNKLQSSATANVTLNNYTGSASNTVWKFKGSAPMDTNMTYTTAGSVTLSGNAFSVTLDPLSVTIIHFADLPGAPSGLSASADSSSQINLAWSDNATNETGFKIERKTGVAGAWGQIATVSPNVVGFTNTGLASSTSYYYRVRAAGSAGDSAYAPEASATTLTPTPPAIVIAASQGNAVLTWQDPGYQLQERSDLASGAWQNSPAIVTLMGTNYTAVISTASGQRFFRLAR